MRRPVDSLCDGLRVVWTQGVVDGDKVVGAVILHVEEGELDRYGFVDRGSDLPLAARPGGVEHRVPGRRELPLLLLGLQAEEAVSWERQSRLRRHTVEASVAPPHLPPPHPNILNTNVLMEQTTTLHERYNKNPNTPDPLRLLIACARRE